MKRRLLWMAGWSAAALLMMISACSGGRPSPTQTANVTASPTPVIITAAPSATLVITPLTTPLSQPGSDWLVRSWQGAQFSTPPYWQASAPGQWQGPDGFVRLEWLPNDGSLPASICTVQANDAKPTRFGSLPEIRDQFKSGRQSACLILPSPDQPPEAHGAALLLAWLSGPDTAAQRLALSADRLHIEAIAASLHLPTEQSPSACDFSVSQQAPQEIRAGGLRITEFAVATAPQGALCLPFNEALAFYAVASRDEAAARTAQIVDQQFSAARLDGLNARLAPFGIHIRTVERRFVIQQNGGKLHANLSWLGTLSLNASGSDFRLPVVDGYDGGTYILSPAGLERQEAWDILLYDRVFPVFVGDDLIGLQYDTQRYPRQVNQPALLNVLRNGSEIDTWSVSGAVPDGGPARGLWSWDGHWLLELPGLLIEDGNSLNDRLGYDEIFGWQRLNNQPLYFYRQQGQVHLSYGGQSLPMLYDDVIHQPLGGNAVALRLKDFESGLFFYARRAGVWYYITIQSMF